MSQPICPFHGLTHRRGPCQQQLAARAQRAPQAPRTRTPTAALTQRSAISTSPASQQGQLFSATIPVTGASDASPFEHSLRIRSEDLPGLAALVLTSSLVTFVAISATVELDGGQTSSGVLLARFAFDDAPPATSTSFDDETGRLRVLGSDASAHTLAANLRDPGFSPEVNSAARLHRGYRVDVRSTASCAGRVRLQMRVVAAGTRSAVDALHGVTTSPQSLGFSQPPGSNVVVESSTVPGLFALTLDANYAAWLDGFTHGTPRFARITNPKASISTATATNIAGPAAALASAQLALLLSRPSDGQAEWFVGAGTYLFA